MDGLRDHLARFRDTFLSSDQSHMSVNDMWASYKSEVIAAIERFIPTKMTKTKSQSSEMHIGNIFPIYSLLRRKVLIPTALEKMKRQKSFGHL